ncbi:MAG: thioredoxin family protein [Chthoniobacteraceae bacterium]
MKAFMCKMAASGVALMLVTSTVFAAAGWGDDYEKGLAQAKAEKKLLVLDFTGSDWCGWCIRLDKEVFSKKEFKDYAKDNLVLVEVDFPQAKQQSKKLKAQNEKLQGEFGIKGYPTIVVLNGEGKKVGELGYQEGGPGPFTAKLDTFKGK